MIRRWKIVYILYNIFKRKKLLLNQKLYKKLGLNKYYFSPVSSKDFKNLDKKISLHNEHIPAIEETALFQNSDLASQESLLNFENNGYAIIEKYLNETAVDTINKEINNLLQKKRVDFTNGKKIMFAIHKSKLLNSFGTDNDLTELLSSLLQEKVKLFQSINFMEGSEQHTHSDSIHMTTFPLGGLLGVWIALEDITLYNGPLHYYPGSHKLPYYLNEDYDNEGNFFLLGKKGYSEYEKMIEEKIEENSIEKLVFTAKKGDVIIWHANLFHGGEPHLDKSKTRKSMVFHYFANNRICYHEISQRPALMG